jgi:hypothetical protein
MIYGEWHGGASYSPSTIDDRERFASIAAAEQALRDRERHGYWQRQDFDYLTREPDSTFTPAVDRDTTCMWLYGSPSSEDPSLVLDFGPRGGVRRHRV